MAIVIPCSTCVASQQVRFGLRRTQVRSALPDPTAGNKVFIFGMGYTSQNLAHALQQHGWNVSGTCRSEKKRAALESQGFRTHLFNPDEEYLREDAIVDLRHASHVVNSIPPVGDTDPVLASFRLELLQGAKWLGYLSSTSVYGDWQGEWVDEDTEPRPVEQQAIARWEAEKRWMQLSDGACVRVFRLGGIYGPGRSALDTILSEKQSSRQKSREQKRFTSRVHVADICLVIEKAMASKLRSRGVRVYNVVDDDPSPRGEVMSYARRLLRVDDDDLSLSSYNELPRTTSNRQVPEKRVSNRRIKAELQVELMYPSFRSGLCQILQEKQLQGV